MGKGRGWVAAGDNRWSGVEGDGQTDGWMGWDRHALRGWCCSKKPCSTSRVVLMAVGRIIFTCIRGTPLSSQCISEPCESPGEWICQPRLLHHDRQTDMYMCMCVCVSNKSRRCQRLSSCVKTTPFESAEGGGMVGNQPKRITTTTSQADMQDTQQPD